MVIFIILISHFYSGDKGDFSHFITTKIMVDRLRFFPLSVPKQKSIKPTKIASTVWPTLKPIEIAPDNLLPLELSVVEKLEKPLGHLTNTEN